MHLNGLEWHERPALPYEDLPEYESMRDMGMRFERRNKEELMKMIDQLLVDKYLTFNRYVKVVENFGRNADESPAHMSYGRMVALIAFGGLMACCLAEKELRSEISAIAIYTSKFLEKRIKMSWAEDNRSWSDFMERAEKWKLNDLLRQQEVSEGRSRLYRWSLIGLATAGVVGIGAFAITRAVLSR
ncbi:unnamed protein product [Anisakis simplex]|uniref:Apoptosis regulator ced-9 (inferred by orthology to a C. elegans protein) n=1 Tax=Anisakis simplex TaxID=6269 RepID=A0A0M3K8C8_ANISI|nr:unnamed protein product [Anisakis simplex]